MARRVVGMAAALVLGAAVSAQAIDRVAPYGAVHGGWVQAQSTDMGLLHDVNFEGSFGLGAAYGWDYRHRYLHWALEAELGYRRGPLDDARFGGSVRTVDGALNVVSLMANALWFFDNSTAVTPYVMGGAGAAWVDIVDAEVGGVTVVDDSQLQFAFQLGAGLGIDLVPKVSLDVGYRYFSTSKDDFTDEVDQDFDFRYSAHYVYGGLRFLF